MNKYIKIALKYFAEFLIVAAGVFLGVYLSAIQSDNKLKAEKEKSQKYIVEELQNNRESLQKAIAYHEAVKIEIDSIYPTLGQQDFHKDYFLNDKFRFNTIKGWRGIFAAQLDNTAFEGTKISGIIKEYEMESVQSISKVYNTQKNYSEFAASIMNRMMSLNSTTKVIDVIGTVELMTTDLLGYEKMLLKEIEKTQEELERNK